MPLRITETTIKGPSDEEANSTFTLGDGKVWIHPQLVSLEDRIPLHLVAVTEKTGLRTQVCLLEAIRPNAKEQLLQHHFHTLRGHWVLSPRTPSLDVKLAIAEGLATTFHFTHSSPLWEACFKQILNLSHILFDPRFSESFHALVGDPNFQEQPLEEQVASVKNLAQWITKRPPSRLS